MSTWFSIVQWPVTSAADPSYQQTDSFNKMRSYGFQRIMICWLNIFTGPGVCPRVPLSSDFCRLGDIPSHGVLISTRERHWLWTRFIHSLLLNCQSGSSSPRYSLLSHLLLSESGNYGLILIRILLFHANLVAKASWILCLLVKQNYLDRFESSPDSQPLNFLFMNVPQVQNVLTLQHPEQG